MLDAGLDMDGGLVRHAQFNATGGREQTRLLLALPQPPTAIVAGNDAQAFGVLQAMSERGLRAPDDVSVVGFDDVPVAAWATPPLTTVRQPLAAMAAAAFRMLYANPGGSSEPHHIELATTLVVRDSTGPPRR
jgi:LacI family transcriptional regulator